MSIKTSVAQPFYLGGAKIFIVDDKLHNLDVLHLYLEQGGYEVAFANTGEKALQLIPKWQPHLVLLDIMMTPMDGFMVCRHLKEQVLTAQIPIMFISALNSSEDLARGFREGGVDYLTKPLSRQETLIKVKTQLERLWYRQYCLHLQQNLADCADYWLQSETPKWSIMQLDYHANLVACDAQTQDFLQLKSMIFPIPMALWMGFLAPHERDDFQQFWTYGLSVQGDCDLRWDLQRVPIRLELQVVPHFVEPVEKSRFTLLLKPLKTADAVLDRVHPAVV